MCYELVNPCINVSIGLSFYDSFIVSNSLVVSKFCAELSFPCSITWFQFSFIQMFSSLYRLLEHNCFNAFMTMCTHTLPILYAFFYCKRLLRATSFVIVSLMNCGNAFWTTSSWTCTLIIDHVKPIWGHLYPQGLICANAIRRDTSLSSSSVSVFTSGSGVLHLIWSGFTNRGSFPFSSDLLHGRQIFLVEYVLSFSVKLMYYLCKLGVKDLMFFAKFNSSKIAHAREGVSSICFI
jgi:hypothetical protein